MTHWRPAGKVLQIVVAGEAADLAGVDRALEHLDRPVERVRLDLRRIVPVRLHDEADRVGHLGQARNLALELRIVEELVDRRDRPSRELRVVGDAR
jgi:hypothetical protein